MTSPSDDTETGAGRPDRRGLLIRHALILDGSGAEGFEGDLLVQGERVAAIGQGLEGEGASVVEADGLVACPGFVDSHGHSDLTLLADPRGLSKLSQGITTEACGQCGMSAFPVPREHGDDFRANLAYIWAPVEVSWRDAAGYLEVLSSRRRGLNLCPFLGGNTVALVQALEGKAAEGKAPRLGQGDLRGLWGLTLGLGYEPLCQWPAESLRAICEAAEGKMVAVHLRNEGERLLESIEEALGLGGILGVRVEIAHLKVAGDANWGKVADALARIEEADRAGMRVGFDAYPYTAGSTYLASTLPSWLAGDGHAVALRRLRKGETRARLRVEHARGESFYSLPPDRILVAQVAKPDWAWAEGLSLAQIGEGRGTSAFDAAVDLLIENQGDVTAVFFSMSEDDVRQVLAHPLGSLCTDGLAYCPDGPTATGRPHPRCYGAFPRFLGRYVREGGLVDWPEAVRKCTSLAASRLGLRGRGMLRAGWAADLVLFDPARIADRADYGDPHRLAEGVEYVIVNGVVSVAGGAFTGELGGRALAPERQG